MSDFIVLLRLFVLATMLAAPLRGEAGHEIDPGRFRLLDVFELEWASDPRISPDGERIVYARNFMDVMSDRRRSNLWIVGADGSGLRPLTTGLVGDSSPRRLPRGRLPPDLRALRRRRYAAPGHHRDVPPRRWADLSAR